MSHIIRWFEFHDFFLDALSESLSVTTLFCKLPKSENMYLGSLAITLLGAASAVSAGSHSLKRTWRSRAHHALGVAQGQGQGQASPHTAPTYATAVASNITSNASGCGAPSPWKFDDTGHLNVTMGDRSFLIHLPLAYKDDEAHPLVFSFHGFKANDSKQEEITGFSQPGLTLNGKGLIAVYPNGQFGPGKNGNQSIRAWQGAPYAAVSVIQYS